MAEIHRLAEQRDPASAAGAPRVLVAYASRHGSTRGVAERIAARLREHGVRVEALAAADVTDVDGCDAVVFGSAVYDQSWLPEGARFVDVNRDVLAQRPVWLFSVGTFGDNRRVIGRLMTREPRGIADVRRAVGARGYRVFAGIIDRRQWPALSRLFFHALGGRLGDNRDWGAIDAWADGIADALDARLIPPSAPAGGARGAAAS